MSKITHPHIIRMYDQGFADDCAYTAMEYFEFDDPRQLCNSRMTQQSVLGVIKQMAAALDAIRRQGVVHRDIKPENVIQRVDKSVELVDLGIAKSMQITQENGLIQALQNDVIGTPHYLSSEQACGQTIIRQSDLYSLGTMMFEMLAGKHPFMAGSLGMLLAQHLNAQTPALSARTRTPAARRQSIDTQGFRPALRFSTTFAGTSESVAIKKCTAQAPCF